MANQTLQDVNLNFDEGQMLGLNNDETITLNNSRLTINSDVRWAQNAAALGSITISDTQGGEVRIRGNQVWELPFGGGHEHYDFAVLLLGFDNEIVDESKNPKTISVIGSPDPGFTKTGVTISHSGLDFTGSSHLSIDHTGTDFDFGSNNLMISFNMFSTDTATTRIILSLNTDPVTNYAALQIGQSNGFLTVRSSANNSSWGINSGISVLTTDQLNRVFITKFGTTWRIWINNTLYDTFTSSVVPMPYVSGMVHRVGARGNDGQRYIGMLDELLVVNGFAFNLAAANITTVRDSIWSRKAMTHSNPTTGNVPSLGTINTNTVTGLTSGATGELLRVFTDDAYLPYPWPVTAGQPMPKNGYIKLRTKTGNFIAGETVSLPGGATAILSSEGNRSWINIVGGQSRTVTIPRLGKFDLLGDYYYIGVTNGKDNQTFQSPVLDQLGGIEIETAPGSGIYRFWSNAGNRWAATPNQIATDLRGRFFGMVTATGVITIAGRTGTTIECGYRPPAGCKVRIPNVILTTSTAANWDVNTLSTTLSTRYDFTTTGNGDVVIDKASCNWYFSISGAFAFRLLNSSTLTSISIANVSTLVELNNVAVGQNTTNSVSAVTVSSCRDTIKIENLYCGRQNATSSTHYSLTLSDCNNFTHKGGEIYMFGAIGADQRPSTTGNGIYLSRVIDFEMENVALICGQLRLNTCVNGKIKGSKYADQMIGLTTTVAAQSGIHVQAGCVDIEIDGFEPYEGILNVHPYSALITSSSGCDGLIIKDIGTMDNPFPATVNPPGVIWSGSVCSKVEIYRCYLPSARTSAITTANTIKGLYLCNVWGPNGAEQAISAVEATVRGCSWNRSTGTQSAVYGTHWAGYFATSPNNMYFNLSFNEPTQNTLKEMMVRGYGQDIAPCILSHNRKGAAVVLSEDRLSTSNNIGYVKGLMALDVNSGLNEWEVTPAAGSNFRIGIGFLDTIVAGSEALTVAYLSTGEKQINGVTTAYGDPYTVSDVITVLVDRVSNTISFKKNNVLQGVALSGLSGTYYPMAGDDVEQAAYSFNFGGLGKAYPPHAGYESVLGMPVPKFTSTSRLVMPNFGDEVVCEFPFFLKGVIALRNASVFTGTNESNFLFELQYNDSTGWNGEWLPMSGAHLTSITSISQDIGLKIKVRITCNVPSNTNAITHLRIDSDCNEYGSRLIYPEKAPIISSKITNITPGSRVQIHNLTQDEEVFNDIVTTSTFEEFSDIGDFYNLGDQVRIRVTYVSGLDAMLPYENTREISSTGFSITITQAPDITYVQNAIDGSLITEFDKDPLVNNILIDRPDGETTVQRGYAWFVYMQNTEEGIRRLFGQFEAIDLVNYRRNVRDLDPWFFYNVRAEDVRISGGYVYSSDGSRFIATGSGSIFLDAGKAYALETGVSGLTAPESELLNRIAILSTQTSVDEATRAAKLASALAAAS